jgi:hypothetical protein
MPRVNPRSIRSSTTFVLLAPWLLALAPVTSTAHGQVDTPQLPPDLGPSGGEPPVAGEAPNTANADAGSPPRGDAGAPPPAQPDAGAPPPPSGPDAGGGDGGVPAGDGSAPPEGGAPAAVPPAGLPPPIEEGTKPLEPGADRHTGIRGRIGDRKTREPIAGAPVLVRGQDGKTRSAITDPRGAFQVFLPPGTYTVRSYFSLYHGARMEKVRVARGAFASVNLVLDPLDVAEEVVVQEIEIPYRADTTTAAAQDQLRKESKGIGEGMGAKQMSEAGAGDAAAAARRVVGVTIESNQLVVRGLGGRYVRVFMNGLPIPNTDPDVPSVDLDLFPTTVIDSLNVQKVFLPDMSGEFAGGVLDINTVSFPRKFLLSASVGTAYNSNATFKQRLTYQGGSYDWLGFDDGTRALPKVVEGKQLRQSSMSRPTAFPTLKDVETAGEQFQNTWNYERTTGLPQIGLNLAIGDSLNLPGKRRFGYLAALLYDYVAERQTGVSRPRPMATATGDAMEASRYDIESGNTSVQLTAIGTASVDLGLDHSLTALTMFNRSLDDQTRYRFGYNAAVQLSMPYFDSWQLRFLTRTVLVNQLLGDHRNLGGTRARIRWSGFYSLGRRDEPDQRVVSYGEKGGIFHRWYPTADRLWSELGQVDLGGTAQLRLPLWAQAWGTLGGRAVWSDRDFSNRRFQLNELSSASDPTAYEAGPEVLFGPEGLGTLTRISEATKIVDSYTSAQRNYAGFLLLETPVVGPLSAAGGARAEFFSQDIASRSPFPQDNLDPINQAQLAMNRSRRTDFDVLPGGALKYALSESMLLRGAYGYTLSRPQARELAPYDYYDFLRDRLITGNPNLKTARIHNGDLRWEWFFGEGQVAAVSAFYKRFIDPIELQIISADGSSQYRNANEATTFGTELELRSELARFSRALRWFSAGGNLSLIRSRIDVGDVGATRSTRRLAGQAPYVINLSLRFVEPATNLSLGLIYNVVGPRITDVGIRASDVILPDIEEQAFHSLDFVGSWGVGKHLKLKLRARNLLFQRRILTQGSLVALDLNPGITVSLGLGYER